MRQLEVLATKKRDKAAALKFMKRAMKRYGKPETVVTDGLRSRSERRDPRRSPTMKLYRARPRPDTA